MGISERMGDVLGQAVESKLLKEVMDHPVKVQHLAIIMDGNRRFAWKSNFATGIGHRIGKEKLEKVLDWTLEIGIPWLTVYALSTENLNRPEEELKTLFKLYNEG
jgi:tritrans,polycis-undecaprenyl-diphosphate synthase [geranylgeranyl-diphosphate specific]